MVGFIAVFQKKGIDAIGKNNEKFTFKIYKLVLLILLNVTVLFWFYNNNYLYSKDEVRLEKSQELDTETLATNLKKIIQEIENAKQKIENAGMKRNMKCYRGRTLNGLLKIDDILLSKHKPMKDKSIFFHETTCFKDKLLKLNARQACAIESTALLNPNTDIFILFASTVGISKQNQTGIDFDILEALRLYKNVYFRTVNLWRYARGTPVEKWLDQGAIFYSDFIKSHVADLLRYITLWRWGGTHLDLDIVLIQTLENIQPNFVGAESPDFINGAIINLDSYGIGHEIAEKLLKYSIKYYYTKIRSSIGPYLITDIFKRVCNTNEIKRMTPARCSGFQIFDENFFYAIEYTKWYYFFYEKYLEETMRLTNESIAIHLSNLYSKNQTFPVGSKVAYGVYAEKYCPNVYSACGKNF